jgi:hypothetical protein
MKLILDESNGRVIFRKRTLGQKILKEALITLDLKKANQNGNGWLYAEVAKRLR